jgi:predicted nucleotidyltransferase
MPDMDYYRLSKQKQEEVIGKIASFLAQQPQIVFAFLFGSFLTDNVFRDIDIGIFVERLSPAEFLAFEINLACRLEKELNFSYPLEVKIINAAPLAFAFQVIKGKLLFSRDDELLTDYMEVTAHRYLDIAPCRDHYIKEAMA